MKRILGSVVLALLLVSAVVAQFALVKIRPVSGPVMAEGFFAALGGLRSIVAEVVWFRADRLQAEGRYVELAHLARTLTHAEPHVPEIWSYAAWNLAYNVSIMMPSGEDRWRWILAALRLLRDDGLKYNPKSSALCRELALLYEIKLGVNIDSAAPIYREKWREIVNDISARGAWNELGMEQSRMQVVDRLFAPLGNVDRTDPLYSAVYWAQRGLECAKPNEIGFLQEIIRQSLAIYSRRDEVRHG